jgi:hypothetical protein
MLDRDESIETGNTGRNRPESRDIRNNVRDSCPYVELSAREFVSPKFLRENANHLDFQTLNAKIRPSIQTRENLSFVSLDGDKARSPAENGVTEAVRGHVSTSYGSSSVRVEPLYSDLSSKSESKGEAPRNPATTPATPL